VPERGPVAEALILDALRREAAHRALPGVLLIGMQAATTVRAAVDIVGSERLVLLHLDRSTEAVGAVSGLRELYLGDDLTSSAPFTLVALNVEAAKSYRLLREIVRQAATLVGSDGVVLVGGPRRGGAEVAAKTLREQFESVELLGYRKGERIYRASGTRPAPDTTLAAVTAQPDPSEPLVLELRGQTLRLVQDERIFARGRLDPATRMLAEVFEIPDIPAGAAVLDLGSGSGILGILAARLEPSIRVTLVDSDPLAVEASRRNAVLNGASNVTVHLSDLLADLPDARFDLVVMNPPFHRGRAHDVALGERFIAEAGRVLLPGGIVYVVCNRFLRYEPTLERHVGGARGGVREVAGDRQYKVLLARRPR
jgi:16S rRNA (guanine1207-N2)-methyltransferase